MKIIHFHPDAIYAQRFVRPLMEMERSAGYETHLVVSKGWSQESDSEFLRFDWSSSNFLRWFISMWKIRSLFKHNQPDVVVTHNTRTSLLPLAAAFICGVQFRVYFNHGVPYIGHQGIMGWALKNLEKFNIALATEVVTVSQDMMDLLADLAPKKKSPTLINCGSACGIDLESRFQGMHGKTEWREKHGIDAQDLIVVFIGRPEKRKGFQDCLRLFTEHVLELNIKLVMCGPSGQDVIGVLGYVPDSVIPFGFIDNVGQMLAYADVLILPSHHEGLSYAVLEAQASGTLVLANDIPGVRCAVQDQVNGILIKDNDLKAYSAIIKSINLNREAFRKLEAQAYVDVQRFSRHLFAPEYLRFLQRLRTNKVIIFVVTTPFAVNAFLRNHLLALAKQYKVILCVNLGAYPLLKELLDVLKVIDIGIQRKVSVFQDIKVLLKLVKIMRYEKPDAVHSLTPKAGLLAMLAARISGISLRSHTFTGQIWVTQKGWKRFFLKQMDRLIVLFASNSLVDSGSQRQLLIREKICSASALGMLGSGSIAGVDSNRFRPNAALKSRNRKTLGVAVDVCVYLFVGRINRDKGVFDLLKAFHNVATKVPKVELWMVGPDEENLLPILRLMSQNYDVPIRFFKETPKPEVLMASADIMLLPSYREGFGVVIIEAAACEIPTIAYRIDGVVDAVQEGQTGILVDVGDIESFSSAMKVLALDACLRRRLGKQARSRASQIFDSEFVTDKWVDFYSRELEHRDCV